MTTNDLDGSVDDLSHSRYLTKADAGDGLQGRIRTVVKEDVSQRGTGPEIKHVVYFTNLSKGMVLNRTRGQQIAEIAGSRKFRVWRGVVIEMYDDPSVTFGGRITGGIRVREPEHLDQRVRVALDEIHTEMAAEFDDGEE